VSTGTFRRYLPAMCPVLGRCAGVGVQWPSHSSKFAGVEISRPMAVKIVVNGESRELAAAVTVAGLLEQMELTGRRVAVEVNGEIVPRSEHGTLMLKDQDRVEVVFAIGGGSDNA
jgi:sulfur carrier protein